MRVESGESTDVEWTVMVDSWLKRLEAWFGSIVGSLTAFSGGVDSALVLYTSRLFLGSRGIGVIADSPSLKRNDLRIARDFCDRYGITLRTVHPDEIEDPHYTANPVSRCYFCKSALYETMRSVCAEYPGYAVLNGANVSDLGDYRPGMTAAAEHGVMSPLADCGIGKAEIRSLARHFGLPVWDKPASPCLSSRIPYGQEVTRAKLERIEDAEAVLNEYGFDEVRVRHRGDEAHIEVPVDDIGRLRDIYESVEPKLTTLGFARVVIDDEGLVSGKLNRGVVKHENG